MSFSAQVKQEILDYFTKSRDLYIIKAERFGEYLTEAQYKKDLEKDFSDYFEVSNLSEDEIKAIVKGVFLATGCIVDPNNDYRYEAGFKNKSCAEYYVDLLSLLDFTPKLVRRQNVGYAVYFRESEQVSYMLSLLEANKAVLEFEQIRVIKDVNNNNNRANNCELANSVKKINTSRLQLEAIRKIRKASKFAKLNEKIRYTALLREENPTASLEELVALCDDKHKVSKSGLKHRLDKLIQIAEEL